MRVALLSTFHETCGIATYSESLVDSLRREGAEVVVLSPRRVPGDLGRGEQPRRLWSRSAATLSQARELHAAIRELAPDVVHAQVNISLFSPRALFALGELLRWSGIPFVATMHGRRGGSFRRDLSVVQRVLALRSADLVVHNPSHAREMQRLHGRVHVVPHGVDTVRPRAKADARAAIGLDPGRRVIAHFGFLVPDKGVLDVLESVARLRARGADDLYYWICGAVYGSDESRAHMSAIEARARELGLREHVHLTGEFLPEDRAMLELSAADWIVLSYRTGNHQGASGAVRRALTTGRPVAVSRAPVFDDVRAGTWTLDGPLDDALARIARDDALADETARRGHRFCEENSWPSVAGRHLALYEAAASRGLRRRAR